jgi:hypothetical protein
MKWGGVVKPAGRGADFVRSPSVLYVMMPEDQLEHVHDGLVGALHVSDFKVVADRIPGISRTLIALEEEHDGRIVRQTADPDTRTIELYLIWL